MKNLFFLIFCFSFFPFFTMADVWDDIRENALAPNNGPQGRPLPLAGNWADGWYKYNWGDNRGGTMAEPKYMLSLIKKQHRVLVNFAHLNPDKPVTYYTDYALEAITELKQHNQPIVITGTQYEQTLYTHSPYIDLPAASSPKVLTTGQELLEKLTAFPPLLSNWFDVGKYWTEDCSTIDLLQGWYPNPPKVIFLGNNEANKLSWTEVDTSQRYINLYGTGHTDDFKREKIALGRTQCYQQLFNGMTNGLEQSWQNISSYVCYLGSGPWECFGRWGGWVNYSNHYSNKITWEQNAWNGCSTSYYLHQDVGGNTDFRCWGMQIAIQNRVFMLQDQLQENPDFWHELSPSKGGTHHFDWLTSPVDVQVPDRAGNLHYGLGQVYDGARYKGLVQFGMWTVMPRVVRHYGMGWHIDFETEGFEYFNAVIESVDRVYTDPVLRKFWKYSTLVENTSRTHPYQSAIPAEFASKPRWFQLNTNLDPALPWTLTTEIPVFAIARVMGTSPNREWLLYAHSPLQARSNVEISLPGYGTVTTDVSKEGTFVHIRENDSDLIASYNLNDNSNDSSGNNNHGTLVNNPVYIDGKINKSIVLDKTAQQFVNCGKPSIMNSQMEELTVSVWVKADSLQDNGIDWILAKGSLHYLPKCGFSLRCWHKKLDFFVVGSNNETCFVGSPELETGKWYHIAGVYKGGEYLKLYVNGEEYSTTSNIPQYIVGSPDYDLHIGSGSYCGYHWDGAIDEVKIFNRALTQAEIIDEAHKVLHLDFEENDNGQVADISGTGNNGSMVNSPVLSRERTAGNNSIKLVRANQQYVNCGNAKSLDFDKEFTIDTWVKADSLQANGIDWIIGKGSLYYLPKCGYSIRCWHKKLAFFVAGPNNTTKMVCGPDLEEDVWYHIVAVYKAGEYIKLIVNDKEYINTDNIPQSIQPSSNYDLHIGSGSYCSYPWDGVLDEVKIYNKALK